LAWNCASVFKANFVTVLALIDAIDAGLLDGTSESARMRINIQL
jgi:hypothetical protein